MVYPIGSTVPNPRGIVNKRYINVKLAFMAIYGAVDECNP